MDHSPGPKQIFKYDMLFKLDHFKVSLKQNLWKYFILMGFLTGWATLAFIFGDIENRTNISIGFSICFGINLVYFSYDPSLQMRTFFHKKTGIKQIDTKSMVASLSCLNYMSEAMFQPPNRDKKDFFNKSNMLILQNMHNNHAIATMGVELKAVPFHIQANFNDFLRKVAELKEVAPLTFQVDFSNSEEKTTSTIFQTSQIPDTIGKQTKLNYRIFFTRKVKNISNKMVSNLVSKMKLIALCIQDIIEVNFPHYHFEMLQGIDLIRSIKSAWSQEEVLPEDYEFTETLSPIKGLKYLIRHYFPLLFNLSLVGYVGMLLFSTIPYVIYGVVGMVLFTLINMIARFRATFYFRTQKSIHSYLPIDLFPTNELLYLDPDGDVWIHTPERNTITCRQHFSMRQLNRAYHQNNTKLYRALMNNFNNTSTSFSHQYFLDRVTPNEMIAEFRDFLQDKDYALFEKIPGKRKTLEREYCGFYRFQNQFTLATEMPLEKIEDFGKEFYIKKIFAQEQYLQILNLAHPSCEIKQVSSKVFFQSICKNRRWGSYSSPLFLFCAAGIQLSELIMIPEEIHRVLPMYYAGEFSTPYLNDEIFLGSTFNPENFTLESEGGINIAELWGNILLAGDNHRQNTIISIRIIKELLKHNIPAIIFDWDGTWKSRLGSASDNESNPIQYLEVGNDFGLKLFDLPITEAGEDLISYIEKVLDIFGRIFHWNNDQISILRSAWITKNESGKADLSLIVERIEAFFDKSPATLHKSEVFTMMNLFKAQQYFIAFDRDMSVSLNPLTFIESASPFILDLSRLKVNKYKNLFIQVFLTQLQFLLSDYTNEASILPKVIMLPHLHLIFNNRIDKRNHTTIDEMFAEFLALQMPILAESCQCAEIHESIHANFDTIIALRTAQYNHRRLLGSLLKFDGQFTNTSQKSARQSSYQYQYLTSLDLNKGIIYRTLYQKSYVFQFDQLDTDTERLNFILPQNIPSHLQFSKIVAPAEPENPPLVTSLTIEFSNQPSLHNDLHIFLNDCAKSLTISKVIPKHTLLEDLESIIDSTLRNFYPIDVKHRKEKTASILEDLINRKYFIKKTHQANSNIEITGYILSSKAEKCLKDFKKFTKLQRVSSSRTKILDPEELKILISNDGIPIGSSVTERMDSKEHNSDVKTYFEKSFSSKDTLPSPSLTLESYAWQNELRSFLIDLLVETRSKLQDQERSQAIDYLKNQWQLGISSLDSIPEARSIQFLLKDRQILINHLAISDSKKIEALIEALEDFAVTI
ncbi:hypothetical protein NEF87_004794 [Candidatus Lokiarchaeum ossiferum]|uniref:Uncharacterized protein n=1 Tax=Candidatus Lokiarchaeum ossiferum TaxID=2951803 RepID=A0ABY6I1D0_9ARCH|nr:hypothetical protein NEF87_004794 [Candidatus Lokiarchaeum sp. B-35]